MTGLFTFANDSVKSYECPDCKGRSTVLEAHQRPWGYSEVSVTCEFCEGEGYFSEEDWLILKLEGKV